MTMMMTCTLNKRRNLRQKKILSEAGENHGALVGALLAEKQKAEQEEEARKGAEKEEEQEGKKGGIRMGKLKRRKDQTAQYSQIEVDKLRQSVQTLCQSAAPLGKSIDLVTQDIENMGKELDHWKSQYNSACTKYEEEKKMTENTLAPVYRDVAKLDQQIEDMNAKVQDVRARISKNDATILKLLESVVSAR
mmetsp:Transcript_45483/g.103020  ORF Transcript_45483/g.103020 Transcript_45483/m.103020 type:complete len:192 (-) Transcript_45483:262-837(-)